MHDKEVEHVHPMYSYGTKKLYNNNDNKNQLESKQNKFHSKDKLQISYQLRNRSRRTKLALSHVGSAQEQAIL